MIEKFRALSHVGFRGASIAVVVPNAAVASSLRGLEGVARKAGAQLYVTDSITQAEAFLAAAISNAA